MSDPTPLSSNFDKSSRSWIDLVLSSGMVFLESAIFLMVTQSTLNWFYAGILHFSGLVIILGWILYRKKLQQDLKIPVLSLLLTSSTGPYGAIIVFTIVLLRRFEKESTGTFIEWLASLFPEEPLPDDGSSTELFQRLTAGWDDFSDKKKIMTFQDVMQLGSTAQKRETLDKIARYYRREFSPALKMALNDSENSIRVQAATVIAKIEQEYTSGYISLTKRENNAPETPKLLLTIAEHLDAYAYCGILDQDAEQENRKKSLEYYRRYYTLKPDDEAVLLPMSRLLIHNQQAAEATRLLMFHYKKVEYLPANQGMWLLEGLYHQKNFQDLFKVARKIGKKIHLADNAPQLVLDAIKLWDQGISKEKLMLGGENDRKAD